MSDVSKICPQCGGGNALDTRYCAHCGCDTQSALPMVQNNLPVVLSKAAVPMLAGVAGLALSVGWKLLTGMFNQTERPPLKVERGETTAIQRAAPTPRRTITIRTSWAIGDSSGAWRRGESEQTIEFD